MSETPSKTLDCVLTMRRVRDRFSAEISDMSYVELVQWLRHHRYEDPALQRLAEKAARQANKNDQHLASR
jgi:hypothetical protein